MTNDDTDFDAITLTVIIDDDRLYDTVTTDFHLPVTDLEGYFDNDKSLEENFQDEFASRAEFAIYIWKRKISELEDDD